MNSTNIVEVDITKVYGGGRTQIPSEIRRELNINDGDKIKWMKINGMIVIEKLRKSDKNKKQLDHNLSAFRKPFRN